MADIEVTDEAIDSMVNMIEVAEVLAKSMDMSIGQAFRFMLKAAQLMQKAGTAQSIEHLISLSNKAH